MTRRGSFVRADGRQVPRYQCKACGKHYSAQTGRADYRRRRGSIDAPLERLLRSGVSIRAAARLLGVTRRTVRRRAGSSMNREGHGRRHARGDAPWRAV